MCHHSKHAPISEIDMYVPLPEVTSIFVESGAVPTFGSSETNPRDGGFRVLIY
jgi:hypothetical protein